jgi:hypothetical protein
MDCLTVAPGCAAGPGIRAFGGLIELGYPMEISAGTAPSLGP